MRPAGLQQLLDATDAVEREARAVVDGLDRAAANWQPDGGRGWSVVQCLDHLARVNGFYMRAVLPAARAAAARGDGGCAEPRPGWIGQRFVQSLEPPVTRRFRVPAAAVAPASDLDPAAAVAAFEASHAGYRELVDLCTRFDVNRVRVGNPFYRFVPMRMATILFVVPAHDRRHLWQARNVRAQLAERGPTPGRPGR